MKKLYLCISLLVCCCYTERTEKKCARGNFVSSSRGQAICAPCQDGSYMPDNQHSHQECLACTKIANQDLEVVVAECNRTHDTTILCQTGYYRHQARSVTNMDRCVPCSQCHVLVEPCEGYSDTICCSPGESCDGKAEVAFGMKESVQLDARYQVEALKELMITSRDDGASCGLGFYADNKTSNGTVTCLPCSKIAPRNITSHLCKNCTEDRQLPAECRTKGAYHVALAEFRVVSILLFSIALVVDTLYVFLYGRNFLRKYTGYASRRSCFSVNESRSRMIGTAGIDVHIVFMCIHLFGILCEISIINMDEEILWRFTVAVGFLTVILYFFDAVLFLFVKRLLCGHVCISHRYPTNRESVGFRIEDSQVFLDNT